MFVNCDLSEQRAINSIVGHRVNDLVKDNLEKTFVLTCFSHQTSSLEKWILFQLNAYLARQNMIHANYMNA